MADFDASRARRARALRAAQVVTLSLSVSGLSVAACGGAEGTPDAARPAEPDAFSSDDAFVAIDAPLPGGEDACACAPDAPPPTDAAIDAAMSLEDAPASDDAFTFVGDAGCAFPPTDQVCCELYPGGFWDPASMSCAIAVPGPFVPPSMVG